MPKLRIKDWLKRNLYKLISITVNCVKQLAIVLAKDDAAIEEQGQMIYS